MAREPTIRLSGKSTGSLIQRAGSGDISEVQLHCKSRSQPSSAIHIGANEHSIGSR